MPYIKDEVTRLGTKTTRREEMDKIVNLMVNQGVRADGDLNYILYKFCRYYVGKSYNELKNYCGELRQCATEIERKLMASYEDEAMAKNGDV